MPNATLDLIIHLAGPVATIIASITAGIITWRFSSRLAAAAENQVHIAKLKYRADTFRLRHDVYQAAEQIFALTVSANSSDETNRTLSAAKVKLLEGRFVFSDELNEFLSEFNAVASRVKVAQQLRRTNTPGPDPAYGVRAIDSQNLADQFSKLYAELPTRVASETNIVNID